jgi:hypothetical protein
MPRLSVPAHNCRSVPDRPTGRRGRRADPDDTRKPSWLQRRQALSYMEGVLVRLAVVSMY